MTADPVQLSKTVSHALRHEPWLYELELDEEGWVPVEELLDALRVEKFEWASLTEADLAEMIEHSDKRRHELREGKIRSLYGHSIAGKLLKQLTAPPEVLYHGTAPRHRQHH
jgi:putative RNA 2'-phosphotransferase